MFERFTERARQVLVVAQREARDLGHGAIGTEHLLLACAVDKNSVASVALAGLGIDEAGLRQSLAETRTPGPRGETVDPEALRAIGVDFAAIEEAVETTFGTGALRDAPDRSRPGRTRRRGTPFSARAKKALEFSLREALQMGHSYIGTEHLLLALNREPSESAGLIRARGVSSADMRQAVLDALVRRRSGTGG